MDQETKVRENRVRRALERQMPGSRLVKTRRRDPRAADYGTYQVVNAKDQTPWKFLSRKLRLGEVEKRLGIGDAKEAK